MKPTLTCKLFDEFELANPFWVASAHFSDSRRTIDQWSRLHPAAITLKTTADTQRRAETGVDKRNLVALETHRDPILADVHRELALSYFTDGPKTLELLSLPSTEDLLRYGKTKLPETKIGVSILMGEDYNAAAAVLQGADFVELNLKYSARLKPEEQDKSFFEIHRTRFRAIQEHIVKFVEAFKAKPLFIKLTRELPWLTPCGELEELLQYIRHKNREGMRLGLIVANTRQMRIPATWVADGNFARGELASGVLTGHQLFLETYNIVRNIRLKYGDEIPFPIIATGGIVNIYGFLEIVRAGAAAVQLCTAMQIYGLPYCDWLVKALEELIARSGQPNFAGFMRYLQLESDSALIAVRQQAVETSYGAERALAKRLKEGFADCVTGVAAAVEADIRRRLDDTGVCESLDASVSPILTARVFGLPTLNQKAPAATKAGAATGLSIVSARANVASHWIAERLKENGYVLEAFKRSADVVDRLASGSPWDCAILPMAHLGTLRAKSVGGDAEAVVLGVISTMDYQLRAKEPGLDQLTEVYYFAVPEATECWRALQATKPALVGAVLKPTDTSRLVFMMLRPRDGSGYFAKEPLASLYASLSEDPFKTIASHEVPILLIGSRRFCEKGGSAAIHALYADIDAVRNTVEPEAVKPQVRAQILDLIRLYLPEAFWLPS